MVKPKKKYRNLGLNRQARKPTPPVEERPTTDLHPVTGEVHYTEEEREYLLACDAYRRERRRPFLTATEFLAVAKRLGYRRAD